ncbi:ABC transporter substrate-binding protein [Variovorax boronicumulans]|uniref:ABC transporter substrate-binding protein n=1 Tax=Variovorax boronicumulans TaxID=436515 RepID=UPI00132FE3CF|nr:sugar ABC transporter substrate-binding protein [Variovorax boronicumulans]MDP9914106.1 multiple sugar transport system substrate-binding protein [Variovorax boronicumulans]
MKKRNTTLLASAILLGLSSLTAQAGNIRIAMSSYSDNTRPWLEALARDYEKANPGDKVKVEVGSWENMQQKLQAEIASNNPPDLAHVATRWVGDFVNDGLVEPVDNYANAAFKDQFIPAFLKAGNINGKPYALPIAASVRAMFYNKDMLSKAGFPNGPKTWDDVIAAAKKIKATGAYGYGIQGKDLDTDTYFYYALWSMGGDVLDAGNKAAFNSPTGVKAATLYKSMIDQGLTEPGVAGNTRYDLHNLFKQGRLGMVISLPPLAKEIAKDAPQLKYGITGVPNGGKDITFGVTDSIMMFKTSKNKETAQKFLNFMFSKTARLKFDQGEGFMPVTREVANDPVFKDDPVLSEFVTLLPNARFAPLVAGWEDSAQAVTNALQAIYQGKAEPKAALDKAAAEANTKLNKK